MSDTQENALAILRESLQSCLAIRDGLSYWEAIVAKEGSEIPSYHGGHALALELRKVLRNYQIRFSEQIAIIAPDAPAVDEEAARLRVVAGSHRQGSGSGRSARAGARSAQCGA